MGSIFNDPVGGIPHSSQKMNHEKKCVWTIPRRCPQMNSEKNV